MPNMEEFREQIQTKIRNLVLEFGAGKISNEQFNIIYERYHNQLQMALSVIEGQEQQMPGGGMSTIAIRDATTGKATGMAIYHHRSGTIIETLGSFDIKSDIMSPVLNDITFKLDSKKFIEPTTKKLDGGKWVLFMTRKTTTAIVLFRNEPAPRQIRELERLLHDFEEANHQLLEKMTVDKAKLAKPFLGFVQKKLK